MLNAVAAAVTSAAPHIGSAAFQGSKSLAGFAVSVKAGQWAKGKGFAALVELDEAVGVGRNAAAATRNNKKTIQNEKV